MKTILHFLNSITAGFLLLLQYFEQVKARWGRQTIKFYYRFTKKNRRGRCFHRLRWFVGIFNVVFLPNDQKKISRSDSASVNLLLPCCFTEHNSPDD